MAGKMASFVNTMVGPIRNSVKNMICRIVIQAIDDSKKMQEVKGELFADEVKDEMEHFQSYGFTSNAPAGSEGIALSLSGNRDHTVIINVDNREFRLKNLADGEVALYDKSGSNIRFKADGTIEVNCQDFKVNASSKVDITSPETEASGTIKGGSNIIAQSDFQSLDEGSSFATLRTAYNSHRHNETGTVTDVTDSPA